MGTRWFGFTIPILKLLASAPQVLTKTQKIFSVFKSENVNL